MPQLRLRQAHRGAVQPAQGVREEALNTLLHARTRKGSLPGHFSLPNGLAIQRKLRMQIHGDAAQLACKSKWRVIV